MVSWYKRMKPVNNMEKNLRILPCLQFYQLVDALFYSLLHSGMVGHCSIGKDKEHLQLQAGRYGLVKGLFLQAPGLGHQPAYAVAMHREAEFLFGYGKACAHGR